MKLLRNNNVLFMIGITILLAIPFSPIQAEQEPSDQDIKENVVIPFFSFGGAGISVDDMNDLIIPKGYRRFKDYSFLIGGGFYKKFGRNILEFEMRGIRWKTRKRGTNQSSLKGIHGLIHYGFNVLPSERIALFPYIGGGIGKVWLGLTRTSTAFDTLLVEPVTDISLDQRIYILEAGVGFDVTIQRQQCSSGNPLILGLRAGYTFDPTDKNDWYDDNTAITGGPKLAASGPYARISIGKAIQKRRQKHEGNDNKI